MDIPSKKQRLTIVSMRFSHLRSVLLKDVGADHLTGAHQEGGAHVQVPVGGGWGGRILTAFAPTSPSPPFTSLTAEPAAPPRSSLVRSAELGSGHSSPHSRSRWAPQHSCFRGWTECLTVFILGGPPFLRPAGRCRGSGQASRCWRVDCCQRKMLTRSGPHGHLAAVTAGVHVTQRCAEGV